MKKPNDADRLLHIQDAIKKIERYLDGVELDDFIIAEEKIDAVVRNIEVIGEAINGLSRGLRSKYPHVEWRIATATRNRLIHGYFDVDPEIIWGTAKFDIPQLNDSIELILKEL